VLIYKTGTGFYCLKRTRSITGFLVLFRCGTTIGIEIIENKVFENKWSRTRG